MGNALGTPPTGPNALGRGKPKTEGAASDEVPRRNFTVDDLAAYNGKEGKPIFVALKSDVFDVSASRDVYGVGGEYHALAGKDASRALAASSLADEDVNNLELSDLDDARLKVLEEAIMRFREHHHYPNVGRLLLSMDLSRDELRRFNGVDNTRGTVLVGINGTIYDVTLNGLQHYGPEGSYCQFAGRDASRALACMSLDDACLDDPRLDDLSDIQRSSLADWAAKFQQKYAPVGKLLS